MNDKPTITITGATVEQVFEGKGFKASLTYQRSNGETGKNYYKVWTDQPVSVGNLVDIEGDLTVRVEEFTGRDGSAKQVAAVHVNNAVVAGADQPF